jgi:hypothetical protein
MRLITTSKLDVIGDFPLGLVTPSPEYQNARDNGGSVAACTIVKMREERIRYRCETRIDIDHFVEHGANRFSFLEARDIDEILAFLEHPMKNRPDEVNKVISGSEIPPARRKTRLWPVDKNYRRQLRSAAWWNAQTGISSVLTCPIPPFLWVQ